MAEEGSSPGGGGGRSRIVNGVSTVRSASPSGNDETAPAAATPGSARILPEHPDGWSEPERRGAGQRRATAGPEAAPMMMAFSSKPNSTRCTIAEHMQVPRQP